MTLSELAAELRRLDTPPLDYSPLSRLLDEKVQALRRERFDRGTGPDGQPWPPLAASTLRQKRRKGQSEKPLIATGRLREEDTGYGIFHQQGTRTIPARPFAGLSREEADALAEEAADWVREQLLRRL